MAQLQNPYNVTGGQTQNFNLTRVSKDKGTVSMQLVIDGAFNGTTATARFLQSNSLDLPFNEWNALPEEPLTLQQGSNLLQTISFTCLYVAVEIIEGDATAGQISFYQNIQ